MANKDFPNSDDDSDAFRQFKEMIERLFGGQFGQLPFMNLLNDPDILKKLQDEGRVDLGFSLATDENGNININSFTPGMINPNQFTPDQFNQSQQPSEEPFFDVMEDGDTIIVVGDISGYNKEDIHIGSKDNKLVIKGKTSDKNFTKEIELPAFDPKSVKAKLRNGSLEITVKVAPEESGYKISID